MQKGNMIVIVVIILGLVVGGYFFFKKDAPEIGETEKGEVNNTKPLVNGMPVPEGSAMEDGTVDEMIVVEDENPGVTKVAGTYESYTPEKLALAENGDVVLFFHASWCPYCRAAENDINKNLSKIPDGVHILKTDYDSNTTLKQKYGVTYQHTFVQVDSSGNLIKKWSGSETLAQILTNLK